MDIHQLLLNQLKKFSALKENFEHSPLGKLVQESYLEIDQTISKLRDELAKALIHNRSIQRELLNLQEERKKTRERYSLELLGSIDGIWDWELRTNQVYYSDQWMDMLGLDKEEAKPDLKGWLKLLHPDDKAEVTNQFYGLLKGDKTIMEIEHRIRHKNNAYIWVVSRTVALADVHGTYRMTGSMKDITQKKLVEQELIYQASHDSLTGLVNRHQFMAVLKKAMQKSRQNNKYRFAVLFFDLDRFKVINDSLGHLMGDELLKQLAERLKNTVMKTDTVARLGGDEFIILLDDLYEPSDVIPRTSIIQLIFREPFVINAYEVYTDASIGIALSSPEYQNPEDMLRDADSAMYKAKAEGKSRFSIFQKQMHSNAVSLLETETQIRKAIENNQLMVYYQPIVAMRSNEIVSCEALLRFKDSAVQEKIEGIIRISEQTGLIKQIGEFVLESACKYIKKIQSKYNPQLHVSVNVSPQQIMDKKFLKTTQKILNNSQLDPHSLTLELTEGIMMDSNAYIKNKLYKLKELGIQLSVDDFGTGFSSLSYLQKFPFDFLKVDRSFLKGVPSDEGNAAITASIITLGHILGLKVIAEGIEYSEQLDFIKSFECDFYQGYYTGKPMPEMEFEEFFKDKCMAQNK